MLHWNEAFITSIGFLIAMVSLKVAYLHIKIIRAILMAIVINSLSLYYSPMNIFLAKVIFALSFPWFHLLIAQDNLLSILTLFAKVVIIIVLLLTSRRDAWRASASGMVINLHLMGAFTQGSFHFFRQNTSEMCVECFQSTLFSLKISHEDVNTFNNYKLSIILNNSFQ